MNHILLVAPTKSCTPTPVILDLRAFSGATVKAVLPPDGIEAPARVKIYVLIGGDLREVAEISATNPIARIPGGEIYCVTKDATPEAAGVFVTLGAYGNAQAPAGGTAVEWSGP